MHELPQYRTPILQHEMDLLKETLDRSFVVPADRELARIAEDTSSTNELSAFALAVVSADCRRPGQVDNQTLT
jgi:hypothetical protein